MNIRFIYGRKMFRPWDLRRLKILGYQHDYHGVSIRKPCPKSVFHCCRVLILSVMQNNKNSFFGCGCTIISLAISDRKFSRSLTVGFVFVWALNLLHCKTQRIFMNIKWLSFFYTLYNCKYGVRYATTRHKQILSF